MIRKGQKKRIETRETLLKELQEVLRAEPMVKFAYVFGSSARGLSGPLSDVDIAVYVGGGVDLFAFRPALIERLVRALGFENIDVVLLNKAPVGLRYSIISTGIAIKEDKARRVEFETSVLKEYLDFAPFREIQSSAIGDQIRAGEYFG